MRKRKARRKAVGTRARSWSRRNPMRDGHSRIALVKAVQFPGCAWVMARRLWRPCRELGRSPPCRGAGPGHHAAARRLPFDGMDHLADLAALQAGPCRQPGACHVRHGHRSRSRQVDFPDPPGGCPRKCRSGAPSPPRRAARLFRKPASLVGMDACSSSRRWARELTALGHGGRPPPPQGAKPHAKRTRTDAAGAEAICAAAGRPGSSRSALAD